VSSSSLRSGVSYAPAPLAAHTREAAHVLDWSRVAAPALSLAAVASLGALDGGYFPREWGWSAIAFLWVAALALALRSEARLGRLELAFLAGLGAYAVWIAASLAWSEDVSQTVLEIERSLAYVGGVFAVIVVTRRRSVAAALGGVLLAVAGLCSYALATRLFPERLGTYNPIAGYRLSVPLGYWNALGILAALGVLLALAFAARARSLPARALGATPLPLLATTLYFTYSRGAWIALAAGFLAAFALDPRRLPLLTAGFAVAPPVVAAVAFASAQEALTRQQTNLALASDQGHRLALLLAALGLVAGSLAALLAMAERRFAVPHRARQAFAVALVLLAVAGFVAVFLRDGGPVRLAHRAYDGFSAPPSATNGNLNSRLFNLSSNGRQELWSAAWSDYTKHPLAGSGSGSYEQYWYQHRPSAMKVRDAHSLYLEALAELGPVGLALLLGTLACPLVAAVKMRRYRLAAPAAGAYVAYLVHAGVDWDWEVPAVTLAALVVGCALLVAARGERSPVLSRRMRVAGIAAMGPLVGFAFVGLVGNVALRESAAAASSGDWGTTVKDARLARTWAPWSPDPWRWLAESQVAAGDDVAAHASFRQALAKDPGDWRLWYELALSSSGAERAQALARASALNPLSPEIAALRSPGAGG
jgi:hypothetical protein